METADAFPFPLTLSFIAALLCLLRFIPPRSIISSDNMSHCVKLGSTYVDSIHTREVAIPELKQLRST